MASLTLKLPIVERDALFKLAEREQRTPRDQATLLIRQALKRRGLLPAAPAQTAEPKRDEVRNEHVPA